MVLLNLNFRLPLNEYSLAKLLTETESNFSFGIFSYFKVTQLNFFRSLLECLKNLQKSQHKPFIRSPKRKSSLLLTKHLNNVLPRLAFHYSFIHNIHKLPKNLPILSCSTFSNSRTRNYKYTQINKAENSISLSENSQKFGK